MTQVWLPLKFVCAVFLSTLLRPSSFPVQGSVLRFQNLYCDLHNQTEICSFGIDKLWRRTCEIRMDTEAFFVLPFSSNISEVFLYAASSSVLLFAFSSLSHFSNKNLHTHGPVTTIPLHYNGEIETSYKVTEIRYLKSAHSINRCLLFYHTR